MRYVLFELSVDMVRLVSWPVLTSGLASRAATVVALAFMLHNSLEHLRSQWKTGGGTLAEPPKVHFCCLLSLGCNIMFTSTITMLLPSTASPS